MLKTELKKFDLHKRNNFIVPRNSIFQQKSITTASDWLKVRLKGQTKELKR